MNVGGTYWSEIIFWHVALVIYHDIMWHLDSFFLCPACFSHERANGLIIGGGESWEL